MKKFFFLTMALALTAASLRAASPQFTISGRFPSNGNDGKELTLIKGLDNVVQKSVVRGDSFTFSGKADPDNIYGILMDKRVLTYVIPEEGNITVTKPQKGVMRPGGTPLNDRLTEFKAALDSLKSPRQAREFACRSLDTLNRNIILAYIVYSLAARFDFTHRQIDSVIKAAPYKKILNFAPLKYYYDKTDYPVGSDIGDRFTDVFLKDESGHNVNLSDYVGKGKYVLVDFFASWCAPCIGEFPNLKKAYENYADRGLVVLSLGVWDDEDNIFATADRYSLPWTALWDPTGKSSSTSGATGRYGIHAIPHIILFAPDGTIKYRGLRGDDIDRKLKPLF